MEVAKVFTVSDLKKYNLIYEPVIEITIQSEMLWKLVSEVGDSSVRADDIELSRTGIEGLTFLVLIPWAFLWISNDIHCRVLNEITYPFPNLNGAAIEVWE